ncbi:hypothetical protein EDB19DRAFT_1911678 [Suillus lakei]|nr:hypothetical protein EDB19DRAFT_1911678 [Suillus lakei]
MSTPVDTTLTGLKALTAQIMFIVSSAQQIPLGASHFALTAQVSALVAQAVQEHGTGPHIPCIMLSCLKELMRMQNMTPQVWPDWHSIGYNNNRLLRHSWHSKIIAWEALGDHTFDLPITGPPLVGLIPVDLPSTPIIAGNVASPSTNTTTKSRDKQKGKVMVADSEPEVEGSRKRKSPMLLALSSAPPKLAMKSHKQAKSSHLVKSRLMVESEDDEDSIIEPLSGGVLEVIIPQLSSIVVRIPTLPHSPRVPMKKPFSPATHFAFNKVDSPFPHLHTSNALPSSPTTLSDDLSISHTMPNCTNTSKTASLFNLSSSPYHFQSSSAAYICQTIQTIIHSHLTSMITVDTMPFHPHAHQRLQTTKSLCR